MPRSSTFSGPWSRANTSRCCTHGFSGAEARRRLPKRYSATTLMRGMHLVEVATHIDGCEAQVLALSRVFIEKFSEKIRAAIFVSMPRNLQHVLIQQADKFEEYKSSRDRVATIVVAKLALKSPDAMECDTVHLSSGHVEAWREDESKPTMSTRGTPRAVCSVSDVADRATSQRSALHPLKQSARRKTDEREENRRGKDAGNKEEGKGEWHGLCSFCGKKRHGLGEFWTKQKDEANNGRMDIGEVEENIGGFAFLQVSRAER